MAETYFIFLVISFSIRLGEIPWRSDGRKSFRKLWLVVWAMIWAELAPPIADI